VKVILCHTPGAAERMLTLSMHSSTIIECMPSSVNVLNTGFGPSPSKETLELFTDMLSYAFKPVSDFKLEPSSLCKGLQHYKVPCDEFDVLRARLEPKQSVNVFDGINTKTLDGVAVLVCINGIGQVKGRRSDSGREDHFDLSSGTAVLISNQTSIALTAGAEDLECFVAFFNANA
jgi:mannose-6-phosphate isomerase class I